MPRPKNQNATTVAFGSTKPAVPTHKAPARYSKDQMDRLARLLEELTADGRPLAEKAEQVRAAMEDRLADMVLAEFVSYFEEVEL